MEIKFAENYFNKRLEAFRYLFYFFIFIKIKFVYK